VAANPQPLIGRFSPVDSARVNERMRQLHPTDLRRTSRLDKAGHSPAQIVFINFAALVSEARPKRITDRGRLDMRTQELWVLLAMGRPRLARSDQRNLPSDQTGRRIFFRHLHQ
jgi:hypothetical protein